MPDRGHIRWKTILQYVWDAISVEPLALPVEIVMMRDGRDTRLSNELCQGDPQRDIHGDGENILRDDHINVVRFQERAYVCDQAPHRLPDESIQLRVFLDLPKRHLLDLLYVRVREVHFGDEHSVALLPQFTGAVKQLVPRLSQDGRPLVDFQRNTIQTVDAGG